jgi:1-acyl-sn-glycerol-3-phosphate acyltransferase
MGNLLLFFRVLHLLWVLLIGAVDYLASVKLAGKSKSVQARAHWLQREARRLLGVLHIEFSCDGQPPSRGVLVSNHLSYTDILVYGAILPIVFISKSEVAGWPIFGTLAKFAGTLFIRRDLRSDVLRVAQEMPQVVEAGIVLAFFPEGTSTGGDQVLPFRTPLLAPIVQNQWAITPAFLTYDLEGDGSVADEVAYWRDMVFGPHLLNLLRKKKIRAIVKFGETQEVGSRNRKQLAVELRSAICALGGIQLTDMSEE